MKLIGEKLSSKKLSDQVADHLEEWIAQGKVKPGEKLPSVRELCEQFDVGRSAVRDAITTLKGKGMVEVRHGEGTFISHFGATQMFQGIFLADQRDISQLFSVRKLLEAGIAETAAIHHQPQQLVMMKQALEELKTSETVDGWQADYHFHLTIAKATQNDILIELMQTISQTTQHAMIDFHNIIFTDEALMEIVFNQHLAVYEAIESRDPHLARLRMVDHLSYVEDLLHQHLLDVGWRNEG